jgi:hypothetical protein
MGMGMSKHECDCGARYSNLDALLACQNANHGGGGGVLRNIDRTMNDCFEAAAKACEILGDEEFAKWAKRRNVGIATITMRHYTKCAEAIRALKKEDK